MRILGSLLHLPCCLIVTSLLFHVYLRQHLPTALVSLFFLVLVPLLCFCNLTFSSNCLRSPLPAAFSSSQSRVICFPLFSSAVNQHLQSLQATLHCCLPILNCPACLSALKPAWKELEHLVALSGNINKYFGRQRWMLLLFPLHT